MSARFRVYLSTVLFDIDGAFELKTIAETPSNLLTRRVNSVPTLDGSSFVNDAGYSASDRTFNYILRDNTQTYSDNVIRIAKLHSRLILTNEEGVFEVIISKVINQNGLLKITFIVVSEA